MQVTPFLTCHSFGSVFKLLCSCWTETCGAPGSSDVEIFTDSHNESRRMEGFDLGLELPLVPTILFILWKGFQTSEDMAGCSLYLSYCHQTSWKVILLFFLCSQSLHNLFLTAKETSFLAKTDKWASPRCHRPAQSMWQVGEKSQV